MLAQREISSELGFVDNLMAGFVTRSRLHDLRGRAMEAEGLLREGAWLAAWYSFVRMQATILEERMRILLKNGHATEAQAIQREFMRIHNLSAPEAPGEEGTLKDLAIAMAFSRGWMHEGNPRAAVLLLKKWFAFARARHCHRSAIRCGVLLARAQLASGDRRGALRTLGEALVLGDHGGFIRSFIDEGREIEELIIETDGASGHHAGSRLRDYVGTLRRVFENPDDLELVSATRPGPGAGDGEVLSSREIQIIELGSRGLQNADIAKTLFLAQSTVKWYWQRIYEKLDVRRRPDAIRVARENHWVR
jgi:LuxR family maltose regulon positive regulatory protein